ncbi:hypothetical protein DITRI_Ditri07aG0151500 [Diplodiscus trichospermus]
MPWLLARDFNVPIHPDESSNYNEGQAITTDMQEFIDCRNNLALFDHVASRPLFTWTNKHQEGFLAKKLDRVLINDLWKASTVVEFLAPEISDHCPALIQFKESNLQPPKPFKFFNFSVKCKEFLQVVENSWTMLAQGNPMKVLFSKLKRLKLELKKLNKLHFDDISARVNQKRGELQHMQHLILSTKPDSGLITREQSLSAELLAVE